MTLLVTPAQAISDPNLLGNGFRGPSWNRWRACLKAIFGERLTKAERVLFSEVAERSSPRRPVREAWFLCGRRAGKDSIAAACATIIAAGDYRQFLRPGEVATVACLAVSKDQARIVLNYIRANFLTCPMLAPKVVRETDNGLELNNQVEIVVLANNFRSVRGKTVLACIFDEIALWRDETAAYPDAETYSAIRPAMATLPDALLIAITTVYRKAGLYYDKSRTYYGVDDPEIVVIKATTRQFNPLIDQSFIDAEIERDQEANRANTIPSLEPI